MDLKVSFEGDLADRHRLPAYDGAISLQGLTRSIVIVANFVVEGRVRRRDFSYNNFEFYLVAQREGSFETLYQLVVHAAAIAGPAVADGVAANLVTELLKLVYRRVIGQRDEVQSPSMQQLQEGRSGDLIALVEAAEPSIRVAHNVINHGVVNINIFNGGTEQPVARLDARTKRFVWESVINNGVRAKLFSIGSFNANNGTGRAFDFDEGRSVSFELDNAADRETVNSLLDSINSYTMRRRLGDNLGSAVAIQYTSVDAIDGRVKKIRVLKARQNLDDLA